MRCYDETVEPYPYDCSFEWPGLPLAVDWANNLRAGQLLPGDSRDLAGAAAVEGLAARPGAGNAGPVDSQNSADPRRRNHYRSARPAHGDALVRRYARGNLGRARSAGAYRLRASLAALHA